MFPKQTGDFPVSRDFEFAEIPCKVLDCPANNGRGKCVSPAVVSIRSDGRCEMFVKLQGSKFKGKR